MKALFLSFVAALVFTQPSFADYYEREGNYLYKITPYTQLWTTSEGIQATAQVAHQAMTSILDSLMKSRILPDSVMSREDLEKFRKAQEDMDDLVVYLNDFIQEQRVRGSHFEKVDLVPDALIILGGHKWSMNIGKGVGAAALAGLVVMPVKVTKIDIRSNKAVDEYASIRTAFVGWPSLDAGLGVGGGSRWRAGLGMIWDLNHAMVSPDQFWGVGPAVSASTPIFGIGGNVKAGVVSNWEMPGWVDFVYATAALEIGAAIEVTSHRVSISTIMKGEALMGLLDKSQQELYKESQKIIAREIDRQMRLRAGLTDEDESEVKKLDTENAPEILRN